MIHSIHAKLGLCLLLAAAPFARLQAADDFATTLAKDCYVLKDDKLTKLPDDTFKGTKLYIVYYSHISCGICIPVTKALNEWFEKNKQNKDISLVFATRGENNNKELLTYVKKSKILYPALDTKHYTACLKGGGVDHAFYNDADAGVPRFRFFAAAGSEIDPRKHGVTDSIYTLRPADLDAIAKSILKMKTSK